MHTKRNLLFSGVVEMSIAVIVILGLILRLGLILNRGFVPYILL